MQIAIQMGLELEEEEEEPKGSDLSILLVNISYYSNDGKNIFLVFEWQGVTPRFFVCPWDANIDAKIYVGTYMYVKVVVLYTNEYL